GRNLFALAPAVNDFRLVALGVDLDFEVARWVFERRDRNDLYRLSRGEHSIHSSGADSNSLLAAAHAQTVKLGTVKQLAKDQRDLLPDDARTVVLNSDFESFGARRLHVNPEFGNDAGFFTGVQRVVDCFLHCREQSLARIIKSQQ